MSASTNYPRRDRAPLRPAGALTSHMRSSPISTPRSRRLRDGLRVRARGFTLVEIMVVVAIISFLAMMAVPAFRKLQSRARATATANDLRVFETAFETYASEKGVFPPSASPGELPPEMAGRIKGDDWTQASPIGGHFTWERNVDFGGNKVSAAITITSTSDSTLTGNAAELEELDRILDDGNLSTGNLIFGGSGSVVWIVEH